MAAARKTTTTTTVESPTLDEQDPKSGEILVTGTEEDKFEQDLVAELLAAGIEEEITYAVRRVAPADKAAYCTKYSRGDLNLDRIREDWGAGTYTITAFDASNKYRKRVTVKIAEGLKPALVAPSLTGQLAEMAQILRANVPTQAPQAMDMGAVLIGIMQNQTAMLTAIMNRPIPTPPPPPDPLAMIAALKDVLKPEKSSSDVDILLKGLTLGKEISGGSDWTDVVTKGLDAVVPLLGSAKTAQATPPVATQNAMRARPAPPPRQLQQAGATDTPKTDAAEGENVQIVQKLQWLTRQATVLCHQAAHQKDPALYAEVFLDNLPEFFTLDEVYDALSKTDAVDQLGKLHAPVLEHRKWFEDFRREALSLIAEDEDDAAETTNGQPEGTAQDPVSEDAPPDGSVE